MTDQSTEHASLPILSVDEASAAAAWSRTRRSDWTQLHPAAPAFILGTAAYLEQRGDPSDWARYAEKVARSNRILEEGLGSIIERIRLALQDRFDASFSTDDRYGLPGLHIFEPSPHFMNRFASTHFDRQWELLDLSSYTGVDSSRILSFTLPLELPTGGGGLLLWPKVADPTHQQGQGTAPPRPEDMDRVEIEYQVGELVIHDGWHLHEMAPFRSAAGTDARITLQGHAIRWDRGWIVHW